MTKKTMKARLTCSCWLNVVLYLVAAGLLVWTFLIAITGVLGKIH